MEEKLKSYWTQRQLETVAVFYFVFMFLIAPIFSILMPIYLFLFTSFWWLVVAYFVWFFYDLETPLKGGRSLDYFRNQIIWKYFVNYFPINLIKTADLPTNRNYIFGSHPHGIMSIGNFASFCTNATNFNKLFPGIQRSAVTLRSMFYFPLRREMIIGFGGISSDAKSIESVLKGADGYGTTGRGVSIVLGGAEEALDSHSENFDLNLKSRRGFIRLALQNGADLVPVYHFGETSLFYQIPNKRGTLIRKWQTAFKNYFGISPPIFFGRGIFNTVFGALPYRVPINTVVGAPIHVEKNENPTKEDINKLHEQYCEALTKLFESQKTKFNVPQSRKLNIY